MKMNKGDAILICILLATFVFFAINEFNILIGISQYDSSFVTLFGVIFGGELLSFAIYRIGMAKYEGKRDAELAKYIPIKNSDIVNKINNEIEQIELQEEEQKGKHVNE